METYLKTIGVASVGIILCMVLSKNSKDFAVIISIISCCAIAITSITYFDPVIALIRKIYQMTSMDNSFFQILLRSVGVAFAGETVSTICSDAGHGAIGKTIQFLSTTVILWIALPLINSLLDLIEKILELA